MPGDLKNDLHSSHCTLIQHWLTAHESRLVCYLPFYNPHNKNTLCQILSGGRHGLIILDIWFICLCRYDLEKNSLSLKIFFRDFYFFNGISTFLGYQMLNHSVVERTELILFNPLLGRVKHFHAFSRGISGRNGVTGFRTCLPAQSAGAVKTHWLHPCRGVISPPTMNVPDMRLN